MALFDCALRPGFGNFLLLLCTYRGIEAFIEALTNLRMG